MNLPANINIEEIAPKINLLAMYESFLSRAVNEVLKISVPQANKDIANTITIPMIKSGEQVSTHITTGIITQNKIIQQILEKLIRVLE